MRSSYVGPAARASALKGYRQAVESNPNRVALLADRARILAWSDRPEKMPP